MLLGVGMDRAEEAHLVALGRPGEGVIQATRVLHRPAAVDALLAKLAALEPDPTEVRVAIWSPAAAGQPRRTTTAKTPASCACWPWTASPLCGR